MNAGHCVRVLVTGAGGQLGQALLRGAPAHCEVIALARSTLDVANATQVGAVMARLRPALILNAAAYTAVDRAESEPELATEGNVTGPRNLAAAAAACGARLLHVSTDFVFDGAASKAYSPEDATHPLSVYGRTKLAGERAVLDTLGPRAIVLRTAWLYAASGANFLQTMLRLMAERGLVRVVCDQIGTPTAVPSLARAIWQLADLPAAHGVFHWTDAGVASWYDFAVAIADEAARAGLLPATVQVVPIATSEYPTAARRPRFSVLDCKATSLATGIEPMANHWRSNLRGVLGEMIRA